MKEFKQNFQQLDSKELEQVTGGGIFDFINGVIYEITRPYKRK